MNLSSIDLLLKLAQTLYNFAKQDLATIDLQLTFTQTLPLSTNQEKLNLTTMDAQLK